MPTSTVRFDALESVSIFDGRELEPVNGVTELRVGHDRIRVGRASDVLYLPDLGMHLVGDHEVPLENVTYSWSLEYLLKHDFFGMAEPFKIPFETVVDDRDVCILSNLWHTNFFIWVTESLTRAYVMEQSGFEGCYVVNDPPPFAYPSLAMLGISRERIVDPMNLPTRYHSVSYGPAFAGRRALEHPDTFRALRSHMLEKSGSVADGGPKRIWMDRQASTSAGRLLANRDEIAEILERHGFQIIDLAALPFEQQIGLTSGATALAGTHGAAFVHTLFMPSGGSVIECFSPRFISPSAIALCRLMKHRYSMLVYEYAYDGYPFGDAVAVDPGHLELVLSGLS